MKRKKKWLSLVIAIAVVLSLPVNIYAQDENSTAEDKTLAPYFVVEGGDPSVDSFPLKETQVTANINGVIADVYVTQIYSNDGTKPINAGYVFPASTRASVHGMKMEIGDKVVTAKIKEREEAKSDFEKAKNEGKSASLLEEERPNVFSMNVANIMPGDTVRIELHYTELITSTDGTYQFVFPTVVGPRYSNKAESTAADSDKWVESPYIKDGKTPPGKYNITVNLSTGLPISKLECKSHKVDIAKNGDSSAKVTLSDPEDYAGNRDYILDYQLTGQEVQSGLMLYQGEDENYFMLMVQPPERVKQEVIPPREYIFVLDVSGSMNGYPIDTAKELIKDLVTHLNKTDRFNLVLFSGASVVMSPESVPATSENVGKAINLIDQQDGSDGTEIMPALENALSIPRDDKFSRSVVIITDGFIDCESDVFYLISKNLNKTNFFSFGIGSSVNRYLIEGIAKAGLGEPFVVTETSDSSKTADKFREYIQSPVLTDIKVEYNGFETYDVEPPSLPDLFAQRPVIVFGKWRGTLSGTIQITGKSGNGDYSREIKVSDVKPLESNSAIRYLWARSKVARLLDYGVNTNNPDVKGEVTSLGLKYSMLTPYTSFIAVLDEIRNTGDKAKDVKQPLPLAKNVSNLAVGGTYAEGSEPGILIIAAGVVSLLSIIVLRRRKNRMVSN